ncbi:L-aspartate oxidase [Fulvimarina manganoxydans]|uniref:L-aspartate oxidase n=1 Tax=Fulvimarina manganoxydans TaxID=937218 RepID=A0A1W2AY00_9HYPH|nr:L-aspartate oxidase [Fulvimarina manganoxydans]SMC65494.1 L-aspartate oxidase [Fulvimarina manganoxydans]
MTGTSDPNRFNAIADPARTGAIVVGAGVAGLATALRLAEHRPVTVVTASPLGEEAATGWAQGGIAAAMDPADSPLTHAADTLKAGAGLTDEAIARKVAMAAPDAVRWLEALGTPFDRAADGTLALGLEAAHSQRRIVRAGGDGTGRAVLDTLVRTARMTPAITLLEGVVATALLKDAAGRIAGTLCRRIGGGSFTLAAPAVVLATGGIGALYAETTNPPGATASGLALAARAGAVLRDVEFVQFHPTGIAVPHEAGEALPLATEALRGEGAILLNSKGERFMNGIEGRELAPRDVVARAIFGERAKGETVLLDATHLGAEIATRFPTVTALCRAKGIDPAREPIPVTPAAHYHMGGIEVDERGRTSLPGLWAAGECASSGLHGANRLASNSLVEALAFAGWIAADIVGEAEAATRAPLVLAVAPLASPKAEASLTAVQIVRRVMADRVGVSRNEAGLIDAIETLLPLAESGHASAEIGLAIAVCAFERRESRGGHYRSDCPYRSEAAHSKVSLSEAVAKAKALSAGRSIADEPALAAR